MIEDFEMFPLPPPWRQSTTEGEGLCYVNDDTGEITTIHPYQRVLDKLAGATVFDVPSAEAANNANGGSEQRYQDNLGVMREDSADGPLFYEGSASIVNMDQTSAPQQQAPVTHPLANPLNEKSLKARMRGQKYQDFRCMWKEFGLMGETNSYGLVIRYYPDGQTVIKFDGVEGMWHLSQLTGPYGPIDRYDLFVGAKVMVFGRHMSIASCGASTCRWIEDEGRRLAQQQEWLQQRIESVGAVPLVHRAPPVGPNSAQGRSGKPAGSDDLRRRANQNAKLAEQLAGLGMAHCVAPTFYTKFHTADS